MATPPPSIRTALSQVSFLGSARSGTAESWMMRVTSLALVPLSIWFVSLILSLVGKDYPTVRAELSHSLVTVFLLLFILVGVVHMKIGMRSIIDDYVQDVHWKEWALVANLFFSVSLGLACIHAVLKLSFS